MKQITLLFVLVFSTISAWSVNNFWYEGIEYEDYGLYGLQVVKADAEHVKGDLVIPGSLFGYQVVRIKDKAFSNCHSLTSVHANVRYIGAEAFYNCSSLTTVDIGNVYSIAKSAFAYCTKLTSVNMGWNVTGIGYSAFYSCSSLKKIEIPSMAEIGSEAFKYCSSLTTVIFHPQDLPEQISADTFYGISRNAKIYVEDFVYKWYLLEWIKTGWFSEVLPMSQYNNPTGIEDVYGTESIEIGPIYSVGGIRRKSLQKGMNIINGKKIWKE